MRGLPSQSSRPCAYQALQRQATWPPAAQVEHTYTIFCVVAAGRRLVQCCEHLHRQDFMRLLSAACIIWWQNLTYEIWMLQDNRESVWALEMCPLFAAAAVLEHGRCPQIPRRDRHVIIELVIVLQRVNLTLALYRTLLNRKYALRDVLKDCEWFL
jgi:hypothetical protein